MMLPGALVIVPLAALFLAAAGTFMLRWLHPPLARAPRPFRIGAGFFFGLAFFNAAMALLSHALGSARAGFVGVLLLLAPWAARALWPLLRACQGLLTLATLGRGLLGVVVFYLFSALLLLYWSWPSGDGPAQMGSLEDAKYANIANYIFATDQIPVLTQHFGQSILALFSLLLGGGQPFLALAMWLYSALAFLALLSWGLFQWLSPARWLPLTGTVIVMMGGAAPSLLPHLVVATGNPFLLNGYTDAIFCAGSFLLFLWWAGSIQAGETRLGWRGLSVAAVIACAWVFSCTQTVLLTVGLLGALFAWSTRGALGVKTSGDGPAWRLIAILLAVVIAGVGGSRFGGLLTPKVDEPVEVGGYYFKAGNRARLVLLPTAPARQLGYSRDIAEVERYTQPPWLLDLYDNYRVRVNEGGNDGLFHYSLERAAIHSLALWSLPLIGLLGAWLLWGGALRAPPGALAGLIRPEAVGPARMIFQGGVLVFAAGFALTYLFTIEGPWPIVGLKWAMPRFLLPGLAAGMVAFACLTILSLQAFFKRRAARILGSLFLLCMISGTLINMSVILHGNLTGSAAATLPERLRLGLTHGGPLPPWRSYGD